MKWFDLGIHLHFFSCHMAESSKDPSIQQKVFERGLAFVPNESARNKDKYY